MRKKTTKEYVSITDSYKYYIKNVKNHVDISTYRKVLNTFHKMIIDHVIDNGDLVYLPLKMGTLAVKGAVSKPRLENGVIRGLPIRWSKTFELWNEYPELKEKGQVIYCTNEHTGGVRYKFFWERNKVYVKFKSVFSLRISRDNKRRLSKSVIDGKEYENYI